MATLSERDAHAWQSLAERISATLHPRLGRGVLANRTFFEASSRQRLGPALDKARHASAALTACSEVVIRTDVRAFYPSVNPSIAFQALGALQVDSEVASGTAEMLERWGSEGYPGLPIGPPGSAVIANAILHEVDTRLEPLPHLRWVDDYLIGLLRAREVSGILDRLDSALEHVGLERSGPKTTVLTGGRGFTWPGTYRGFRSSE
ncbi:MAG: RNA-directed DNA polymerase [Actinomycetota bacterium]